MQERPVAVTIFGILNIGFGVMSLGEGVLSKLSSGVGDLSALTNVSPYFASIAAFMDALHKNPGYLLWMNISAPVDFAANLVLIAAGIGLLMGKSWARVSSIGYAVYGLVFPLLNVLALGWALHGILAEDFQKYGATLMGILGVVALFGLALTLLYPGLLIFFMTRPKVVQYFKPIPPSSTP